MRERTRTKISTKATILWERLFGAMCGVFIVLVTIVLCVSANDGDAWGALFLAGADAALVAVFVKMGMGDYL